MLTPLVTFIDGVKTNLIAIAGALVLLMFTYGAVLYTYSADDAGGRKKAKSIMVNALIGGLIVSAVGMVSVLGTAMGL